MGPQPAGSSSSRAYSGPGGPGTLVGRVGAQQEVAAAGFTSPYADQNIRITPADVGPRFKEAVHAGSLQLESDIERFGAIYNLLTGDEETAVDTSSTVESADYQNGVRQTFGSSEETGPEKATPSRFRYLCSIRGCGKSI